MVVGRRRPFFGDLSCEGLDVRIVVEVGEKVGGVLFTYVPGFWSVKGVRETSLMLMIAGI